jgi:polyhydroxyalkanoate synthase
MNSIPPSASPQGYLENLMRAGQDAMKQFEDALASATGVQTDEPLSSGRPLVLCVPKTLFELMP